MIHLNGEQMIPLQDSELDAVSAGTAVEYAVMLALIIVTCIDPNAYGSRLQSAGAYEYSRTSGQNRK
jgi:hypothetical protein